MAPSDGTQTPNRSVCLRPEGVFQTAQKDVCWKDVTGTVSAHGVLTSQWITSSREPLKKARPIFFVKDQMGRAISSDGGPITIPTTTKVEPRDTFGENGTKGNVF